MCGALVDSGVSVLSSMLDSVSYTCYHPFACHQLAHPYRAMILRAMETVVSSHIGEMDKDLARAVIFLATSEMTRVKVPGSGLGRNGLCPAGPLDLELIPPRAGGDTL